MPPSDPGELRAVLFDMDGTLTDTEKLWSLALDDLASELGGEITPELRHGLVGLPQDATIQRLHEALSLDVPHHHTSARLSRHAENQYRSGIPLRPGAVELLTAVRTAGLWTALVTATEGSLVDIVLDSLGRHHFDVLVTGDTVTHGKPHPEPYLTGLAALGVGADAALAIEDSPNGALSAEAAGLTVVVVPCEIEVPVGDRRVFVNSLSDVTVAYLRTLPRSG